MWQDSKYLNQNEYKSEVWESPVKIYCNYLMALNNSNYSLVRHFHLFREHRRLHHLTVEIKSRFKKRISPCNG